MEPKINLNTMLDKDTVATINADPKRYQWQPFQSEAGYYYVMCDMGKDHNGNLILEKKEEPKVEEKIEAKKEEEKQDDKPFVKTQDPHSAALQPMYKNGKRVVAVEK